MIMIKLVEQMADEKQKDPRRERGGGLDEKETD